MLPFGSEQALVENSALRRFVLRLSGDVHFGFRMRARYLEMALESLDHAEKIFEAGCFRGQTSFWLSRRFPGAHIDSIDIDPGLITHCRNIARLSKMEMIEFSVADLVKYRQQNAADLVVCFDVLEHIKDWRTAVRTLVHQLRAGGLLLIHTPQAGQYQDRRFGLRRLRRRLQDGHHEHEHDGFVPADFAMLRDLGLEYRVTNTFSKWVMSLHNLFEVYRSHSRLWWVLLTPILLILSRIERPERATSGGGLLIVARKLPATDAA
jgi:SAM-dependent methyltransferase